MTDVELAELAEGQEGKVSRWQLLLRDVSSAEVDHRLRRGSLLPDEFDGVYSVGHRPSTPLSRYWGATLTAPERVLSHASLAALHGVRFDASFVTVTQPGSGGPRRFGPLLVLRSTCLDGDLTDVGGLPVTTGARMVLDLAPHLTEKALDKLVRESIRLRVTTRFELHATVMAHRGRRGVADVRAVLARYEALQLERTKSDAEALALQLLARHGRPAPLVNVRHAGEEADLSWPSDRLIIELDGPQFHLFAEVDAIKEAVWRAAGWRVERLPTDDVFDHPDRLLALAPNVRPSSP